MFSLKYLRQTQRSLLTKYQICRTLTQAARAINDRGSDFFDPLLEKFFFFNINTLRDNHFSKKFRNFLDFFKQKSRIFRKKNNSHFLKSFDRGESIKIVKIRLEQIFSDFFPKVETRNNSKNNEPALDPIRHSIEPVERSVTDRRRFRLFWPLKGNLFFRFFSSTLIRFAKINFQEIFEILFDFFEQKSRIFPKNSKRGRGLPRKLC